jgi:hypothetical protein
MAAAVSLRLDSRSGVRQCVRWCLSSATLHVEQLHSTAGEDMDPDYTSARLASAVDVSMRSWVKEGDVTANRGC